MVDQVHSNGKTFNELLSTRHDGNVLLQGIDGSTVKLDGYTVNSVHQPVSTQSRKRNRTSRYPDEDVWSGSRPVQQRDRQATARLLELVSKNYSNSPGELFANRRTKKEVWVEIAAILIAEGYHFSNRETAWQRVSQKWRNLERSYRAHVSKMSESSNGGTNGHHRMEFFDDLHLLLAGKYNTGRKESENIIRMDLSMLDDDEEEDEEESDDSEEEEEEEDDEDEEEEGEVLGPEDLPSPTFSDNKDFFRSPLRPADPESILRQLIDMKAQELAHFREDRRERINMQRETMENRNEWLAMRMQMQKETATFRQCLIDTLRQQHREQLEIMGQLIAAVTHLGRNSGN